MKFNPCRYFRASKVSIIKNRASHSFILGLTLINSKSYPPGAYSITIIKKVYVSINW